MIEPTTEELIDWLDKLIISPIMVERRGLNIAIRSKLLTYEATLKRIAADRQAFGGAGAIAAVALREAEV